jgi:hypothetical protein
MSSYLPRCTHLVNRFLAEWILPQTGNGGRWRYFPDAEVRNVGYVAAEPGAAELGVEFSSWRDEYLGLKVDVSEPPLDVVEFGIRDELLAEARVYSRIHCRDKSTMINRDTCFYFVAWSDKLLPKSKPEFLGVRTFVDEDSEIALVEKTFLESLLPVELDRVPTLHEVAQ